MPTKPVTSPATEFFPLHQAATPHAVRGGNLFRRFCKMLSESSPDLPSVLRPRPQTMKGKFPRTFHKTFGTSRRPRLYPSLRAKKTPYRSIDLSPSVFAPLSFPSLQPPGAVGQAKTVEGNVSGDAASAAEGDRGGEDPAAAIAPAVTKSIQYCTKMLESYSTT